MAGVDRRTGARLDGWPHFLQSLEALFTTSRGARVMRRYVGTNLPRLVDAPISPVTTINVYAAVADALRLEPRFKPVRMNVDGVSDGQLKIGIQGIYFPRGHLGDFSVQEPRTANVSL